MKLKRGSTLEVLKRNGKCDFWLPGTFISEDTYKCTVRYDQYLNCEGDHVVEEVYKEDIRPNPPLVKKGEKWVVGDTVEVFELHCWRTGKVVKLLNSDRCVIKLSGSIQLKEYKKCDIRVKQAWQNSKWVVIQKVGELTVNSLKLNKSNNSPDWSHTAQEHGNHKEVDTRANGRQENVKTPLPVRNLKRKYESSSKLPSENMDVEKGLKEKKTLTKAGGYYLLRAGTSPLLRQVDVTSSLQKNLGKKHMIRSTMDVEPKKTNNMHPYHMSVCATEESNECSVASCSSNGPLEYPSQHFRKSSYVCGSSYSDAESSSTSESGRKSLTSYDKVEIEANIHKLELHAYRLTMQALYASGPLSWEQESLLTNLRLSLHISNEEHLVHLRQLLSSQVL